MNGDTIIKSFDIHKLSLRYLGDTKGVLAAGTPLLQHNRKQNHRSILNMALFILEFLYRALIALTIFFGLLLYGILRKRRRMHISHSYPLPPSPPSEPFFGHARLIPSRNPEVYYQKLSKRYSKYVNHHGPPTISPVNHRFRRTLLQAIPHARHRAKQCKSRRGTPFKTRSKLQQSASIYAFRSVS